MLLSNENLLKNIFINIYKLLIIIIIITNHLIHYINKII